MNVAEIMHRDLITVAPQDSVEEAVKLLRRRGVRHLLVMKNNRLVGIISDRDIKRAMDPRQTKKKLMGIGGLYFLLEPILVEEIMTPNPMTVGPSTSASHAAYIMVERRFGALPVLDNGRTVGIVTETDLLRYFAEKEMQTEAGGKGPRVTRRAGKS
ncbi:MAG: CBS domain-containing protein [Planctomycetes bacterium]|nr:CBS domain-containing protein [Planctomycetota bacterium]